LLAVRGKCLDFKTALGRGSNFQRCLSDTLHLITEITPMLSGRTVQVLAEMLMTELLFWLVSYYGASAAAYAQKDRLKM